MLFRRLLWLLRKSRYIIIIFVTIILSVVIWLYSPYIGNDTFRPFDTVMGKSILVGVLWFFSLMIMLIMFLVRREKNQKLEKEIIAVAAAPESGPESEEVKAEMAEMRTKLRDAMVKLRKSKAGRRSLYELPWYVMIGPPGAGKTTAIVNSGLQFPLADEFGKTAIGGVGGTRNCDWWFTDNAVMIDTAGRYTTQESDQENDNAGWLGFLNLLKRNRSRQPINGAIIAISLSDLSLQDEQTQKGHARAIRRRLTELREKLGVRFPVYVLFTKADLIAGFTEYFDTLGKEEREQVWGFTLPLDKAKGDASPIAAFDTEFAALLGQLNMQILERMQSETDHQRRSLIAGFPSQVASLRGVAQGFLAEVFQENRFEERHMLRGVYFASGTQEGTPIDRLMMSMARTFGIGRQAIGSGRGTGRSYFLTRLFEQVIFQESGLVSADDKVERRYRWSKRLAIAATVIFALVMGGLWTRSFLANRALMAEVTTGLASFQSESASIPPSPVSDTKLEDVVPSLNILRDLPVNVVAAKADETRSDPLDPPSRMSWGLYQGASVATLTGQTYRAALNEHLLPRMLVRLEFLIQNNLENPEKLFDILKVYLMLGPDGSHRDVAFIEQWFATDFEDAYPGPSREELRADLVLHLRALLNGEMEPIELNGPLVEQAQTVLLQISMADRVFNGIIKSPDAVALPAFFPTVAAGQNIMQTMVRQSGAELNEPIEGIFTYDGFNTVFLRLALDISGRLQEESWVLGEGFSEQLNDDSEALLLRDVLGLYESTYVERYQGLLQDLQIIPMQGLDHAAEVTRFLSDSNSPIKNLLIEVAKQTRLTQSDEVVDTEAAATNVVSEIAGDAVRTSSQDFQEVFNSVSDAMKTPDGTDPPVPGAFVEGQFTWLQDLISSPDGGPTKLDAFVASITTISQELNRLKTRGTATDGAALQEAIFLLKEQSAAVPGGPLVDWSNQIEAGSTTIAADGTRASIAQLWETQILPTCQQATTDRYPFVPGAEAEVGEQDFIKLFAPNGLIDAFFKENLLPMVDQRTQPWTWTPESQQGLGIPEEVLGAFQTAAAIRDAYFPDGAALGFTFMLEPFSMASRAQIVNFIMGEKDVSMVIQDGVARQSPATEFKWPDETKTAIVGMSPGPQAEQQSGTWALFRVLDQANVDPTSDTTKMRIDFNIGGLSATYFITFGSVINPFVIDLSSFSCPPTL
jgi:type VI secretion system protein ImpL